MTLGKEQSSMSEQSIKIPPQDIYQSKDPQYVVNRSQLRQLAGRGGVVDVIVDYLFLPASGMFGGGVIGSVLSRPEGHSVWPFSEIEFLALFMFIVFGLISFFRIKDKGSEYQDIMEHAIKL